MRIDESNYSTIKRASDLTLTDYDIIWKDAENIDGYICSETMLGIIEDLISEIDRLEEKIKDIESDIRDNYKRIPVEEQVGISDRDFI